MGVKRGGAITDVHVMPRTGYRSGLRLSAQKKRKVLFMECGTKISSNGHWLGGRP